MKENRKSDTLFLILIGLSCILIGLVILMSSSIPQKYGPTLEIPQGWSIAIGGGITIFGFSILLPTFRNLKK
jgi:H+/Cl- antiporter ClcA